ASSLYSSSKFGLRGMSLGLRRELLGTGVHVSLVAPGFIRTAMTAKGGKRPLPMPGPEVIAKAIVHLLEHPRPEVIAPWWYRPICWLESLVPALGDMVVQRSWKRE
ncbi:MAG: SDR family NAD(P)-dependent oxidoreductase, partial [Deinococcales bacterium]